MRISILKLNVLTDEELKEKLSAMKEEGRRYADKQNIKLLEDNHEMAVAIKKLAGMKKVKKVLRGVKLKTNIHQYL